MLPENQQKYIDEFSAETIVKKLAPYITNARKNKINTVIAARLDTIHLAFEAPSDLHNVYAAMRTCEVLGVYNVHIIAPEGEAGSVRLVTQGAFYWLEMHQHESFEAFFKQMKKSSIKIAAGVLHEENPVELNQLPCESPICLLLGNEQRGLSDKAKAYCDWFYKIPMHGMTESLNLSVSAAISLYDICQRKRTALEDNILQNNTECNNTIESGENICALNSGETLRLTARYYLNSVEQRLTDALLKKEPRG